MKQINSLYQKLFLIHFSKIKINQNIFFFIYIFFTEVTTIHENLFQQYVKMFQLN